MNDETEVVEVSVARSFDVSCERVFDAWLDPGRTQAGWTTMLDALSRQMGAD